VYITITDTFGRRIIEISETGYHSEQLIDLDLGVLAVDGVYFLSITNAAQNYVQRLVNQR
jgi:hypothetical protein